MVRQGNRTCAAVLAALLEEWVPHLDHAFALAVRVPLSTEYLVHVRAVEVPPLFVHCEDRISPRREAIRGVRYDNGSGFLRGRPRLRFGSPSPDKLAVVSGEARAAGEADDGSPAALCFGVESSTIRTSFRSASARSTFSDSERRSPLFRGPECSKDCSATTSVMIHSPKR